MAQTQLRLDLSKKNDLTAEEISKDNYEFNTSGTDPYVFTAPLTRDLPNSHKVLSFEYFCPKGLDHLQVYFGPEIGPGHSKLVRGIAIAEGWSLYTLDLTNSIKDWGKAGDFLRLDFGGRPNIELTIRNMVLRDYTKKEREIVENREKNKIRDTKFNEDLKTYLATTFPASVENVDVNDKHVSVSVNTNGLNGLYLAELTPSDEITEATEFVFSKPVKGGQSEIKLERKVTRNQLTYDRLLSKWALVEKTDSGFELKSHARYADTITTQNDLKEEKPTSKKGLGGFSFREETVSDLTDLDITSATINIWITNMMYATPSPDRIEHSYLGKSYYFDRKQVERLDATFKKCDENNIVTASIILVRKASDSADPEIGRLLEHPDTDPAGLYTMPNMTNPESAHCYATALDFLASRYSRPDRKYGRMHHWIMHNEVSAGWVWTNMGEKPMHVFMDAYVKSMRMCYNIARTYNPHTEVFISLTHHWSEVNHPFFYPGKDLLNLLVDYSKAEGDFEWAIAQHPYPQSLRNPRTWLDYKVQFGFNSPLLTFKNLEVIDAWVKQPKTLYQGSQKRTLWLSENGTNSPTYSQEDLDDQAAGFALAWKKIQALDGIDGIQWHNWVDHRGEGGLRLGLRKFPDDEENPLAKKPVWYCYQAAGSDNEDEVFEPYKKLIGVDNWDQLIFQGNINDKQKAARNIGADTWVATDALGRKLPGYEECGPPKKDKYVGIFYFLTHTNPDGSEPSDVTKIKAANPENPQWKTGTHYWGEPEIGYYLNYEKWAIRRHAMQLADAGVDVIIMDVTNNRTYPQVYLNICEEFRELRAMGEKTPDIAFLASEISANTLWNDFYKRGLYPDLWFMWKGKPLLLYGQHEQPKRNKLNDIVFPEEMANYFSLRQSWAWTSLPWYDDGKDEWPWVDHFPQTIGWHEDPEKAENVPVAVAQHPLSNIGRSFHEFNQPETDKYDLTPYTDQGLHFQEQWNRALEVDPEFVFVTGWNEWSAGVQKMTEPVIPNLLKWSFYPGAQLGAAGKKIKVGDKYFIDQYNQEFSRDIEPMKGGHTDNYYYQLMSNIRRYKGVQKGPIAGPASTIDIAGSFDQWKNVKTTYYDHIGDTQERNSPGVGQSGPYINTSGRNDIIESKVAYDNDNVYFYVKTKDALTKHTDNNWMLLYIDADQNHSTGWEGYDFLVNAEITSNSKTTIKASKKGKWKTAGEATFKYEGNEMMISIPRASMGSGELKFDFHWADNIQKLSDITEFFRGGDNAPERRANYRFN